MATKDPKKKTIPPKLNKFMHPRNPYRTPPSFKKLASKYPEFRTYCSYDVGGKVHLDFKNPKALRALTTCLLDQDFSLKVAIPDDRLVPTLPLRLNYILWIEDLLRHAAHCDASDSIVGVDIGTGASCVYPLLAARKLGWRMLATETDHINFTSATTNVLSNNLQDCILVKEIEEKTILKGVIDDTDIQKQISIVKNKKAAMTDDEEMKESSTLITPAPVTDHISHMDPKGPDSTHDENKYMFDFTMCNPPFFSSEEETDTMKKSKKDRGEPVSSPTGAMHEKVTVGGEVAFITQMVEESQTLRSKVRLFTTLIGTKSHIKQVKNSVNATEPTSVVCTEFCQGRTMRWGLAWTYEPGLELSQVKSKKEMVTNKPMMLNIPRSLVSVYSIPAIWKLVNKWLQQLKIKVRVLKSSKYFVSASVKAFKPTWLHQRRKKREEKRKEEKESCAMGEDKDNPDPEVNSGNCHKRKLEVGEAQYQERNASEEKKKLKLDETLDIQHDEVDSVATSVPESCEGVSDSQSKKVTQTSITDDNENSVEENSANLISGQDVVSTLISSQNSRGIYSFSTAFTHNPELQKFNKTEYILRCNLQVKQIGGLIRLEAFYLDGSCGKDGLNQLLQFMKNQLTNPVM